MKHALPLLLALLALAACRRDADVPPVDAAMFMPLQTGNYWKVSDDDYLQVTGDTVLGGRRYSVIHSVQDRSGTLFEGDMYFRVDGSRLVQAHPNGPNTTTLADFSLPVGREVRVAENPDQPKVLARTDEEVTFRYRCMLCSASGATYELRFRRGRGWLSRQWFTGGYITGNPPFTEVRINGVVYR